MIGPGVGKDGCVLGSPGIGAGAPLEKAGIYTFRA